MARAVLEPGTAGLRVRRADQAATLPPVYDDDDDDEEEEEEEEEDDVRKTTASIAPCLRHWLTLVMNHTDSLEVWALLHKNAGNHLHSQEDPLSKKEKNPMPQLKTRLIFQYYVVSFAAALPRVMGERSIAWLQPERLLRRLSATWTVNQSNDQNTNCHFRVLRNLIFGITFVFNITSWITFTLYLTSIRIYLFIPSDSFILNM